MKVLPRRPLGAAAAVTVAVVAAVLSGCAADDAGVRPDGPVVTDIEIEGTDELDESEIKNKILTSETGWWPFAEEHRFDPNAWQADLRRIERYYEARGYYHADVVADEVVPEGDDAVRIRVRVSEGEPTTITQVDIRGMDGLPPEHREEALEDLPLEKGNVFLEDDWAGLKGQIAQRLKELGYAEAAVGGQVAVDLATREAKVTLAVEPGQRYRFGNVFVAAGSRPRVPSKWIIDQVQGAVKPGDWFSETALSEAQARVFRMGVFAGVKVNRGAPDREAGTVPVVVDVREAPFHTIELGAGGGVDQARNEVRVVAEYTDRNFMGGLRRLTTRAKAGWAFIPNVYGVAAGQTDAQHGLILDTLAEIEQPRFIFRDVRAQASVGLERGIEPAYSFFGGRFRAGFIWQPFPNLSVFPSYNFEGYQLIGEASLRGRSPSLIFGCTDQDEDETGCTIFLSYLEQVIEWDKRDDALEPKNGYYASLSLQQAGGLLQGTFNYFRVVPEVRGYISFFDNRLTVAGKLRLGTLQPSSGNPEDSPIINRFFSGGGSSHRGFNNRRFSPMQLVPPEIDSPKLRAEPVPVGGNGLVESSIELRYNVAGDFVLATFLDTGMVTRESLRLANVQPNLIYALGIGLRYRTVVGPIRIDFARRLGIGPPLDIRGPAGQQWRPDSGCFGLFAPPPSEERTYAGSPEGMCAFHLSIGEAF